MKKIALVVLLLAGMVLATLFFLGALSTPGKGGRTPDLVNKVSGAPVFTMININNVAAFYSANGEQERLPSTGNAGLWYPRRTSTAIYSAGIIWGGMFNDGVSPAGRVNGQSYNNGTKPGIIRGLRTGDAEDPNNADVRIWRIRRDYATADLTADAGDFSFAGIPGAPSADAVRAQYETDWREWPAAKGAPFYDSDGDGLYTPKWNADGSPMLYPDADEPGVADADQVIWYACNDIGVAEPWTCPESGIEEQTTIWGYNRTDALGSTIFKKYRIIYKGTSSTPVTASIDRMYLMQWADPDLGDSGDDFAGSDVALSMVYVYNGKAIDANYAQFNLPPPASGYDFLQGPFVKGVAGQDLNRNGVDDAQDFAIWNLKRRGPGYINLPMTAAIYFAAGGRYSDPLFTYQGAIRWYQMLRGLPPDPPGTSFGVGDPDSLTNPVTHLKTSFWLDGDPTATGVRRGWVDGSIDQPGDRRICLASGPFNMALGDTQELVAAWVGGLGSNNISSISVMKFNDKSVQFAYDALFNLPKPPVSPVVQATELDLEVILSWDEDSVAVAKTENPVFFGGFAFQGYNVYQLPTPAADIRGVRPIATYDVVDGVTTIKQQSFDVTSGEILSLPAQIGTDSGIKRQIAITTDRLRSRPLVNGQRYYFAVTAYSYSKGQDSLGQPLVSLESSPQTLTCVPQIPDPGSRFSYGTGDTVKGITDVVGKSDASIFPVVNNRTRQTGSTYAVGFDSVSLTRLWFTVTNEQTGKVVVRTPAGATPTDELRIPESGLSLYVGPPNKGMKTVVDQNGANVFAEGSKNATFAVFSNDGTVQGLAGLGNNANKNYKIVFDGTTAFALRRLGPGSPLGAVRVPFKAYDIGRLPSDTAKQVIPIFGDQDTTATTWNARKKPVVINGKSYRTFEPIWITAVAYPTTNDSASIHSQRNTLYGMTTIITNPNTAVWTMVIANFDTNNTAPPANTEIVFNKLLEIRKGDVKRVAPVALTTASADLAKQDVQQIKVFPNPYYGVNRAETDRINRFVTFSHLPSYANIRIFNLAGVLVRNLVKSANRGGGEDSQFFRWDLQNQNGLPVASGIYIAYIELRDAAGNDLGTKTVKFAIIQEQQFLRNY